MVDRVFISDNTFITRNANNNITFSADRYYVKNDPNGSFFLGGVTTTPVLVGRTSGEGTPSPYTNIAGFVIDHSFSRTVVNGLNVSGFNFNIPVNTTSVAGKALGFQTTQSRYMFRPADNGSYYIYNNRQRVTLNYSLDGTFIFSDPLLLVVILVFDMQEVGPYQPVGSLGWCANNFAVLNNINQLRKGGTLTATPSHSSYNEISQTTDGVTFSSPLSQFTSQPLTIRYDPLCAIGNKTNVDLTVTP